MARPGDGGPSPSSRGSILKLASPRRTRSPNAVAVVVPARQAYSHCASVGRRNSALGRNRRCAPRALGQRAAEAFRLRVVDPVDRECRRRARTPRVGGLSGNAPAIRCHCPCVVSNGRHPEPAGQRDVDLRFVGTTAGLGRRAAHGEAARRAPAEADAFDLARLAGLLAGEGAAACDARGRHAEQRRGAGRTDDLKDVASAGHADDSTARRPVTMASVKRSGVADLPLHGGRVPAWLASRMETLGTAIAESRPASTTAATALLSRLSDPFWFQALGCVMGMDWHSSGITTSVMGALKRGLNPRAHELGVYVCGGRGKQSLRHAGRAARRSPIASASTATRWSAPAGSPRASTTTPSPTASRSTCTRFVVTADGDWAVVQQGMNEATRLARRYHWHSATVRDFTADPHTAIVGAHAGTIRNLVDGRAGPAQDALLTIAREDPAATLATVRRLEMPARHDVRAADVHARRLGAVLALAHERELRDFASFLLLEQLGPRTLQSLALVAEVVHGTPTRFEDPARFSFAHGGKDGHPFPVPLRVYDESIARAARALDAARLGHTDKLDGMARLDAFTRGDRAAPRSARRRRRDDRPRARDLAVARRPHRVRRPPGASPAGHIRTRPAVAVPEVAAPAALVLRLLELSAEVHMDSPRLVADGVWMLRTLLVNVFFVRVGRRLDARRRRHCRIGPGHSPRGRRALRFVAAARHRADPWPLRSRRRPAAPARRLGRPGLRASVRAAAPDRPAAVSAARPDRWRRPGGVVVLPVPARTVQLRLPAAGAAAGRSRARRPGLGRPSHARAHRRPRLAVPRRRRRRHRRRRGDDHASRSR